MPVIQPPPSGRLWLGPCSYSRAQVSLSYGIDDLRFATSYWYQDVDFQQLAQRYGASLLEKIFFHMAALEAAKLVSLYPAVLDPGPYAHLHTPAFEALWRKIVRHVWAQWRYEHERSDYQGPEFLTRPGPGQVSPVATDPGPVGILAFCGGGKDSLVAMKLLERADLAFDSYAYSHSVYGAAPPQHALIDGLLDTCQPVNRRRHWVYDDFLDSPVAALYPQYHSRSLLAAETPSSIFGVLPVILQHGYRYIALAHERSADTGNLIWSATGEDVNHQWGKSLEAEQLLNIYLQAEFVSNFTYFSLLKPIYDVVIFQLLRQDAAAVARTHSCNVRKPWCEKCPKCAYVWLNYMAYLPVETVAPLFRHNLLDLEENQLWFRQMLGLETHTPFECIGQIDEVRLAFAHCRKKGLQGRAMDTFSTAFPRLEIAPILAKYGGMGATPLPPEIAARVLPLMEAAATQARQGLKI